ncbi:hypothetical protein [Thiomicrospira sp. WB1]|uniref:hypothetical protein n=1 Tax=Thiomicrospira sp. WB1 TaxID=1685380 RepID=UPI00074741EF|nr:hypothetical protein [Thiomicrospira sp. WB1]KUJ71326.1 hypothetical protein AVO41_07260 [Thiomicrospira sp. WB1]
MTRLIQMLRQLLGGLWLLLTLTVAMGLSGWGLAQSNFLYSAWYEPAKVAQTVATHAPQNPFKKGFEQTSAATQQRLIADLVNALQAQGQGLAQLHYTTSETTTTLLRPGEVAQLTQLSQTIEVATKFWWWALSGWGLLTLLLLWQRWLPAPTQAWWLIGSVGVISLLTHLFWGMIPALKTLFDALLPNWPPSLLHYDHSLLMTLLATPDLFVWTALVWLTGTLGGLALLAHSLRSLEAQLVDKHPPYMV